MPDYMIRYHFMNFDFSQLYLKGTAKASSVSVCVLRLQNVSNMHCDIGNFCRGNFTNGGLHRVRSNDKTLINYSSFCVPFPNVIVMGYVPFPNVIVISD